ncbi:unnamed protein product [Schistocephalus solidus]|uniref:Uncharacterized protein n=1 Tax=Schistocephalus solidus TaxID=70667 RepID=A0A183T5R9_SCHSO|nr:unnamed protein product [Schistocephalus solidus]
MAPASVIVLTNHSASLNTRCANQSLLEFLYQLYTSFNLEANPFETLISPNDEEAILQLVPSFFVHQLWPELCRRRLGLSETSAEDAALQQNVAQFMRSCNLIDRVHLLYSLLQEFASDTTLKEAVFGATYVVTSPLLSWFEMDQIQRTLLAYLSVAVNVKNTLDLALVINRPFRGFGRSFFSTLRRVAKKTGILPGQVVISFPACMTESAATSTVKEDGRLVPYAAALNHLADTIRACQDALSGFSAEDESGASCAMAASCSATSSMSPLAALQAIEACLTVAAKTFSKPPPQLPSIRTGALSASSAPKWPITAVKNAKLALIGRLRLLFERQSEQQELIATPNRVRNLFSRFPLSRIKREAFFFIMRHLYWWLLPLRCYIGRYELLGGARKVAKLNWLRIVAGVGIGEMSRKPPKSGVRMTFIRKGKMRMRKKEVKRDRERASQSSVVIPNVEWVPVFWMMALFRDVITCSLTCAYEYIENQVLDWKRQWNSE